MGRCPSCRKYLSIDESGAISVTEKQAQCRMCCQTKVIVDEGMCDACSLGMRFRLRYECDRCHRVAQIPHPMWRYQASPAEFGSATWACHLGCDDYTHWRVIAEDAAKVPDFDCPESWGRREDWLAAVRRQRHQELSAKIPQNKLVTIRGLKSQPQHNARVGKVVGHNIASGRVSVELPHLDNPIANSTFLIALRPTCITQHVPQTRLIDGDAEGCLVDFDDESQCFHVLVGSSSADERDIRHAHANSIRLPRGTIVRVVGLTSEQGQTLNERFGRILSFDEDSQRYVIDLGDGPRKLKPVNVQP